jgi:hypothetical protein
MDNLMTKERFMEESDPDRSLRATNHMVVPCDGSDCTGLLLCPGWMWKHRNNVTDEDREREERRSS